MTNDPFVKYSKDIAFAAQNPFITSASLSEFLGVSEVAARAHVRALADAKLLSPLSYHPLGGRGRRAERYRLTGAVRFAVIFVTRPESDREKVLREEYLSGIGKPFALIVLGDVSGVLVPAYNVFQFTAFHGSAQAAVTLAARIISKGGTTEL